MEYLLATITYLQAHPEVATVAGGLIAAVFGTRYAWVARVAQALLTAASAEHPGDHTAQLGHVASGARKGNRMVRRAAAKRAAKIIRARMAATGHDAPSDPLEADIGHSDNVPTPLLNTPPEFDPDPGTPTVPSRPPPKRGRP